MTEGASGFKEFIFMSIAFIAGAGMGTIFMLKVIDCITERKRK